MKRDELRMSPAWHRTGNPYFPTAARVEGEWWVLRVNAFPDHPLWTLFVDGERRFDLDDQPEAWANVASNDLPVLAVDVVSVALEPLVEFIAYGSEVGRPCDNPFCCG